ncbi:hypothetical protein JQ615_00145 [Bradyrhizobium jicamae]|uniref:Uncharacterized protein n=1 Tax=Bradyrhizobium jicamae TaxID=280332 RepID=A0ABS5FAH8_9BRAD|nr:hypothetical protein [Bradyrhizobium jicamae]MBR0793796.1 hypothetical protein [Bradyrhizobium jicamae]MBR0933431.1 hypothetical protein [Bradyrhizobium jicamae]
MLRAPSLLFESFGAGDRGGDLSRDQFHEAGIMVVKEPKGIKARDQDALMAAVAGGHARDHHGAD